MCIWGDSTYSLSSISSILSTFYCELGYVSSSGKSRTFFDRRLKAYKLGKSLFYLSRMVVMRGNNGFGGHWTQRSGNITQVSTGIHRFLEVRRFAEYLSLIERGFRTATGQSTGLGVYSSSVQYYPRHFDVYLKCPRTL